MKSVPLSVMNSGELLGYGQRVADLLAGKYTSEEIPAVLLSKLHPGLTAISKALANNTASPLTNVVYDRDKVRDEDFVCLRNFIEANLHGRDERRRALAMSLYTEMQHLGLSLYRLGYTEESALLTSLFARFDTPACQAALTALAIMPLYTNLKQSQADFEAAYTQRVTEEAAKETVLLLEAKASVRAYLQPLLSYIETQALLGDTKAVALAAQLDQLTTETTTIIRNRTTRNETSKAANTPAA